MIKKLFHAAFLLALVTAFFLVILFVSNVSGGWLSNLFADEWIHRGVVVFLEILVWLSGGWLFNRLLSLLFWDTLVAKVAHTPPPLLLVQLSGMRLSVTVFDG